VAHNAPSSTRSRDDDDGVDVGVDVGGDGRRDGGSGSGSVRVGEWAQREASLTTKFLDIVRSLQMEVARQNVSRASASLSRTFLRVVLCAGAGGCLLAIATYEESCFALPQVIIAQLQRDE
jgi:hypothetical protein